MVRGAFNTSIVEEGARNTALTLISDDFDVPSKQLQGPV